MRPYWQQGGGHPVLHLLVFLVIVALLVAGGIWLYRRLAQPRAGGGSLATAGGAAGTDPLGIVRPALRARRDRAGRVPADERRPRRRSRRVRARERRRRGADAARRAGRSGRLSDSRPRPGGPPRTITPWRRGSRRELDSGERVISERLPHVRSVAVGYWIGAGSRDETDAKAGISHFIEHLLFKGSSRYSALEIAEIFDELGGELNAATSREHTLVFARVPDNHVETALDVMGDMVFSPLFEELDAEREVVLEEIAMYEDTPQELVHDLIGEAIFGSHALGRPVIGTAEVISTVSRRALRGYHRSLYTPGEHRRRRRRHDRPRPARRARRSARSSCARRRAPSAPRVRPLLAKTPEPGLRFQRKDTEQYHVCLGAPGVSRSDRRRFAASILDAILGGSASSRLFQEIREKRGMAYSVYSFVSQYAETGQIGIYVGTREDNLVEALAITVEQIARHRRGQPARRAS